MGWGRGGGDWGRFGLVKREQSSVPVDMAGSSVSDECMMPFCVQCSLCIGIKRRDKFIMGKGKRKTVKLLKCDSVEMDLCLFLFGFYRIGWWNCKMTNEKAILMKNMIWIGGKPNQVNSKFNKRSIIIILWLLLQMNFIQLAKLHYNSMVHRHKDAHNKFDEVLKGILRNA